MNGSQQQHFLISIALMLFFFVVSQVEQYLFAIHATSILIGGDSAQAAYLLFSGIAVGMMRGMAPDAGSSATGRRAPETSLGSEPGGGPDPDPK